MRAGLVILLAGAIITAGCRSGTEAACRPVEALLEPAVGHVLTDDVEYQWHPPTSGLHRIPGPEPGLYDEPIAETRQVHALELGRVIIQYSGDLAPPQVAELRSLADERDVIVAPAIRIDDGAIVAFTAWGHRQLCSDASLGEGRAFIRVYAGQGPGEF